MTRKAICILLSLLLSILFVPSVLAEGAEDEGGPGTIEILEIDSNILADFSSAPCLPAEAEDEATTEANLSLLSPDGLLDLSILDSDVTFSIFGKDSRATISNTKKYPYSAIAHMVIRGECGCTWHGSGFMVSSRALVTAAQCLVCTDHATWADTIDFYFGYSNLQNYLYRFKGTWHAYVGTTFSDHRYSADYDYGFVKLSNDVGNHTGWFGMSFMSDSKIENTLLNVAGYQTYKLKRDSGYAEVVGSRFLRYKMDTAYGSQGGPVYTNDGYAVGINIANGESGNYAYRLTSDMYETMLNKNIY